MSILNLVNWRRATQVFLWTCVVILALNLLRLAFVRVSVPAAQAASPSPYTVLRVEKVFDKTGTIRFTHHYTEAVRSDGSRMKLGSTGSVQQREIYFSNGDFVVTDEVRGKKSTYPRAYLGVPGQRHPQQSCLTEEETRLGFVVVGEDDIAGYRALRIASTKGKRTVTSWRAAGFGCAVLRSRLDHEGGVSEQALAALVPGEPDMGLFRIPASFQEVPPSILLFSECPDTNAPCKSTLSESARKARDKGYYDLRAKTP